MAIIHSLSLNHENHNSSHLVFDKEATTHTGEKTTPSTHDAGETRYIHAEEQNEKGKERHQIHPGKPVFL